MTRAVAKTVITCAAPVPMPPSTIDTTTGTSSGDHAIADRASTRQRRARRPSAVTISKPRIRSIAPRVATAATRANNATAVSVP